MEAARDIGSRLGNGAGTGRDRLIRLFVEKNLAMLAFVKPALHAAIEIGRPELRQRLAAGLRQDSDSLVAAVQSLHPGAVIDDEPVSALRRALLGLALDESVTEEEARCQLEWLVTQLLEAIRNGSRNGRQSPSAADGPVPRPLSGRRFPRSGHP